MGYIIKNDEQYGGPMNGIADNIVYDNSTSGLEANNLQDAVDEVSDYLKWKQICKDETIGTFFDLIEGAREYYIRFHYNSVDVPMIINADDGDGNFYAGFYYSSSTARCRARITGGKIGADIFDYADKVVSSSSTYSMYYR